MLSVSVAFATDRSGDGGAQLAERQGSRRFDQRTVHDPQKLEVQSSDG